MKCLASHSAGFGNLRGSNKHPTSIWYTRVQYWESCSQRRRTISHSHIASCSCATTISIPSSWCVTNKLAKHAPPKRGPRDSQRPQATQRPPRQRAPRARVFPSAPQNQLFFFKSRDDVDHHVDRFMKEGCHAVPNSSSFFNPP